MLAIFPDYVERIMEVFMDDFSVNGGEALLIYAWRTWPRSFIDVK